MPYCTHCEQEYPEGTEQCPQCHHLLWPKKPAWRSFDPDEPLVLVRTIYSEPQAYLMKGLLEQEGIPVAIQREAAGLVYGLTLDGLGSQRLLVPESLAEEAGELLAAYEGEVGPGEVEDEEK